MSGSEKRMRDLQATFDEAPTVSRAHVSRQRGVTDGILQYGGDLDWPSTSYSPHDIATIFRRYLTQMPEPVIPHAFYDKVGIVVGSEADWASSETPLYTNSPTTRSSKSTSASSVRCLDPTEHFCFTFSTFSGQLPAQLTRTS